MNLAIAFRSEILKTKRTASWYSVTIVAIAVSALFVLTVSANDPSHKANPWTAIYTEEFKSLNLLVLPMFTTWKLVKSVLAGNFNCHFIFLCFLMLFFFFF